MAIQNKKILSIAILASLLVFSFTVSSSTAISFAQRDGSGGGNQAAAQNSQDGNNDSETGISQSSSSSQSSECLSEGSTSASCNNVSIQANQNGNDEEEATMRASEEATVTPKSETSSPAAQATADPINASVSCGEVIKQSVKLTSNLDCKTDGIIIGEDGITVD